MGAAFLSACKVRESKADSTLSTTAVDSVDLQFDCKGTNTNFDMQFVVSGFDANSKVESDVVMNAIDNRSKTKVVDSSPGRGVYKSKEYMYVSFDAGALTLDWEGGEYFGAATVNGNPEEIAVEVKCAAPSSEQK
jgi:hypothetical protein